MPKDVLHYVKRGFISQADFEFLKELDPSRTKKYLSFIIKFYLAGVNLDLLQNRITEYDTLLNLNQVDRKDINAFKTFSQLDEYVQQRNNIKSTREEKREAKKQADIILNTKDLFIICPQSHAASCLYGYGTRWCITMQNTAHFERYYYEQLVTFYFIQVRSNTIKSQLKEDLWKLAVLVYRDGRITIYDAADHQVAGVNISLQKYVPPDELFKILAIEPGLFVPRGMDERIVDVLTCMTGERLRELDLSRANITKVPDEIGYKVQLEKLIMSENKIQMLPETIGLLTNLKTLYLFHNQLTSLPQSLNELKQLQWLGLTGNMFSNKSIKELKRALPHTRIYMDKHKAA
ncbi:MAG TPA: leucine-rich repeat domain-containing protein [Bacteroidia bacterium]|nr:leucine-rich repeat domain-containing protein [Bacteroidia bacterium]